MTQVLRRVAAMNPAELRFRTAGEIRKAADRLSLALRGTRWHRADLAARLTSGGSAPRGVTSARAALQAGRYHDAHRALKAHFAGRASSLPLNARDLRRLAAEIGRRYPDAPADALARGNAIVSGRYDLLGHAAVEVGPSPDWHLDPVHGRGSPPRVFWAEVPYLDPALGDHKVIWELNRHQHWLALGRAYALTGDPRFVRAFAAQLASWLSANPPLVGTNWASMLELAFRAISWLWALELFAGAEDDEADGPWTVDLLLALDRQLTHIARNLSTYFSPNTHLSGEALALYVAGAALPELNASARREALGRDILVTEAARQVMEDGGHAELSAHYHRYSTDFYLLAYSVAEHRQDPAARIFRDAAARQARFLRTIADDSGARPAIGDDDGGQLFPICGRPSSDCRDTLWTAAILLEMPELAIGEMPEESFWMCGARAAAAGPAERVPWPSGALRASGYFVSRTARGDHLVFDAGPFGFLNGGHAHADALSCTLTVAGRPVLIDPGTGTYTMSEEVRARFRSTMMHNTVVLDGRAQTEPIGPFHWAARTDARGSHWRSTPRFDYFEGRHDAYAPRRHTRSILALHGLGWMIIDHVLGTGPVHVDQYWHLHPGLRTALRSRDVVELDPGDHALALASSRPLDLFEPGAHPLAYWSPAYGIVEPAAVCVARFDAPLPAGAATFVPSRPEVARGLRVETLAVATPPGPAWHGTAYRVAWRTGQAIVLSAVELSEADPADDSAPARPWGPAELQTDARAAALIENAENGLEAVLVNGGVLAARHGAPLVCLPSRTPAARLALHELASPVHEPALELAGLGDDSAEERRKRER